MNFVAPPVQYLSTPRPILLFDAWRRRFALHVFCCCEPFSYFRKKLLAIDLRPWYSLSSLD